MSGEEVMGNLGWKGGEVRKGEVDEEEAGEGREVEM